MPRYPFRNLIFEGGGVKGIAYVGAVRVLEQKGITQNIQRVAGTSVGAINALLFGLNYTNDDVQKILWKLEFRNFRDGTWGFIPDTIRLIRKFGLVQRGFLS
jgi:NTE family protein